MGALLLYLTILKERYMNASSICIGKNEDERMEVFIIRLNDNALVHSWQDDSYASWSSWESLGGVNKQIAVANNKDGRLEVFAIGSDNALYNIWQVAPNS